jgi:hypothetical protein
MRVLTRAEMPCPVGTRRAFQKDREMAGRSLLTARPEPVVLPVSAKARRPDHVSPQSSLPAAWR